MVDNAPNSILLSLRRIIQDFSSKNSFEEAIATFVEEIRTSTDVDCCSLYLLDARRTYLRLAATDGLSKSSIGKANLRVGEGLVGLVAQKQELINLADAPSHPNFKFLPDVGEDEFLSFLGVPVINQGELLGVLVIQSREDRQFDEQEESFLITLSAQIASTVSLNRNKLYQENSSTRFKGQVGTGGIAIAQAAVWKPPVTFNNLQIMYTDERTIQSELFHQTIFQLQTEMDKKVLSMRENSQSRAESGYIHGYGSLLDDSELIDEVDRAILDQGYVAASAIKVVVQSRLERDQKILSKDKMRDLIDFAHILIYRLTHIYSSNDEIQQNALKSVFIAVNIGIFELGCIDHEVDVFILHLRGEDILDLFQIVADIRGNWIKLQGVALNAVDLFHFLDQMQEVVTDGVGMDKPLLEPVQSIMWTVCCVILVIFTAFPGKLHITHDGVHGESDIVGHVGQVGPAGTAGLLFGNDDFAHRMFPPPHGGEDIGHKEQNQHDEHKLYRAVLVQHLMDWCIAAHLRERDFGDGCLPQPEGRGEEIQEKQYRTE